MAHGPRPRAQYRRRRTGETDYSRRLKLLRNGSPRAVVRISNTQTTAQLVIFKPDGDQVVVGATGEGLVKKYGWPEKMSQFAVHSTRLAPSGLGQAAVAVPLLAAERRSMLLLLGAQC